MGYSNVMKITVGFGAFRGASPICCTGEHFLPPPGSYAYGGGSEKKTKNKESEKRKIMEHQVSIFCFPIYSGKERHRVVM